MNLLAKPIMIQGTMSNVGKSIITAALCRIFAQDGFKVAPFKSQNMALNSFITPNGLEIGRAQAMQAEAGFKDADVRMNPILLKPMGDKTSQIVLNGKAYKNVTATEYFDIKKNFIPEILSAYESLAAENDIIVIEGAGSPAEINLNHEDIVNMGLAAMVQAPVILVADIDRGGVFASLYGTVALLPEYKTYFKGAVVNKFQGDVSLLTPAFADFQNRLGFPILGVVPRFKLNIDDEDSLACDFNEKTVKCDIDIAVIKLPKISNFTDFMPFTEFEGVSVRYVSQKNAIGDADLIIIPGTKNTLEDLRFLKNEGIFQDILEAAAKNVPIIGICGGFQMMGTTISDTANAEGGGEENGFGFFDIQTIFSHEKQTRRINGVFKNLDGFFADLSGLPFAGYEIHMGKTFGNCHCVMQIHETNVQNEILCIEKANILGSYIHGLFDEPQIALNIINSICSKKNLPFRKHPLQTRSDIKNQEYNKLAEIVRENIDMKEVYNILQRGV